MNYTQKQTKEVQEVILKMLEDHGTDWTTPWTRKMASSFPRNHVTKKYYNGFNVFWLSLASHRLGYSHGEWATYDQWFKLGGGEKEYINNKCKIIKPSIYNVKKKEKSTKVFYWELKQYENKEKVDKNGDPEISSRWFLKVWNVFNICQIDGIELPEEKKSEVKFNNKDFTVAIDYIKNSGADIRNGGDRAYYSPMLDYIQMPDMSAFNDTKTSTAGENYYSTILHELIHWTGHKDRCNRDFSGKKNAYAFEELVAETGSAMLCSMLGVSKKPRPDHAKYLNNWKEVIKDNPRAIFTAFSKSNKAIQLLDGLQNRKEVKVA